MKVITIVRHAKSSWDNVSLSDHERPLNPRGLRDAPRMAEYLKASDYPANRLIVSSAVRAQETARAFQQNLHISGEDYVTEPELYHAGMREWIRVLERYWNDVPDNGQSSLAFFAHNPGITNMVNWLCDENIFNVPTCGLAIIGFPVNLERIDSGVGTLLDYQIPKAL